MTTFRFQIKIFQISASSDYFDVWPYSNDFGQMSLGPFVSLWVFDNSDLENWLTQAKTAIKTLQEKSGFLDAQVGRSPDQP